MNPMVRSRGAIDHDRWSRTHCDRYGEWRSLVHRTHEALNERSKT